MVLQQENWQKIKWEGSNMTLRHYINITVVATTLFLLFLNGNSRGAERQIDPTAELVASMLKAYGGAEAVENIVSVTAKGRITEFLNGTTGDYARYLERPGKLRIEVMPEQGGEIRVLNGDRGWQVGDEGFVKVSPFELQAMIYQYSYLNLPMGLVDKKMRFTYGGKQQHSGREVFLLLIELKNAPRLSILVDAKTRLIVRVSASFAMGMMGASELSTEYSDFRAIGKVLFPHKLINFAGDRKLSEIVLSEIAIKREIPAAFFAPL